MVANRNTTWKEWVKEWFFERTFGRRWGTMRMDAHWYANNYYKFVQKIPHQLWPTKRVRDRARERERERQTEREGVIMLLSWLSLGTCYL